MKINKIQQNDNSNPGFKGIKINAKDNTQVKYLYNKVLDVAKKEHVGGAFATDSITLSTNKPTIMDKLKEFGIKFLQTRDK